MAMDLSIASATTYNTGSNAPGRRANASNPASSTAAATDAESAGNGSAAAESVSQRPAREPNQASRLTPEEQQQLSELQQRDREVKAHELAHKSVGGRYVTGGSFSYQTGPDGQRYAIGGEVTIDSSSGATPEETLAKAELIRRAALAPADPSPQDYRVASQASLQAAQARAEMAAEQRQETMQQNSQEEENGNIPAYSARGQRAIAAFEAVSTAASMHSDPDPIDEIV